MADKQSIKNVNFFLNGANKSLDPLKAYHKPCGTS
jgi:hypothetical protein